jgi:hypothetical protein
MRISPWVKVFFITHGTTKSWEEVMPYARNHVIRDPKSSKKRKNRAEQLQNVISLRINDVEKKALEKLIKTTSKSISDIMREAIDLWSSKRRKLCMD